MFETTENKIRACYNGRMDRFELFIINNKVNDAGYKQYGQVSYAEMTPGCEVPVAVGLSQEQAQCLMNDLWNAGVRPARNCHINDEANNMAAHLSDMRAIVEKTLKMKFKVK